MEELWWKSKPFELLFCGRRTAESPWSLLMFHLPSWVPDCCVRFTFTESGDIMFLSERSFRLSFPQPDRYWYPPDYPYQQALYNPQVLQHYYQMYGPTSPSGPPYQYMGYMSGAPSPRTSFSPMQQPARPPFFQQPAAQMEGSFPPGPSLPPNFRLQLPPHAVSRESDNASGSQPAQPTSSDAATSTNNQEASGPVTSNSDPNTSN